jgi:hypothetical protein
MHQHDLLGHAHLRILQGKIDNQNHAVNKVNPVAIKTTEAATRCAR